MNTEALPGVGQRLAAAREAKGLSVADIATQLKLSPRQIEALETDDLKHLPGEVFVRGFVRNYARLVGLNPDDLLPHNEVQIPEEITAPSTNLRFHTSRVHHWLFFPLLAVLGFFALVAGLYAWLGSGDEAAMVEADPAVSEEAAPATSVTQPSGNGLLPPQPELLDQPVEAPVVEPAPVGPVSTSPAGAAAAMAQAPSVAPVPSTLVPVPATPARPVPAIAVTPPAPPIAETGVARPATQAGLLIQPAEEAWVQVVDAKGQRFSRLLPAGTTERFDGTPPFRLVVGNAQMVRISFKGRAIDLKPYIGDKVARLSLSESGATASLPTTTVAGGADAARPSREAVAATRGQ